MKGWTEKQVQQLKDKGRIVDYKVSTKPQGQHGVATKKRSKEKDWLNMNLAFWANEQALELVPEYVFHPQRKWRFDYCFPAILIAVEYEGIFSQKSRHTSISGYTGDIDKYNSAQALGWRIIRVTAKDYKTILQQLKQYV